jgi:hypothetical protein
MKRLSVAVVCRETGRNHEQGARGIGTKKIRANGPRGWCDTSRNSPGNFEHLVLDLRLMLKLSKNLTFSASFALT